MPVSKGLTTGLQNLGLGLAQGAANLGRGLATGVENGINRAGEAAYDAGQAIHNYMTPPPPNPYANYPAYMRTQDEAGLNNKMYLGHYAPSTLPATMPDIPAYRADPTGRFGGKDGLETLPTTFTPSMTGAGMTAKPGGPLVTTGGSPAKLYAYARELGRAQHYGVPQLTATQLAALALKEGRDDYGHNAPDSNNPQSTALIQRLVGGPDAYAQMVLDGGTTQLEPAKFAATVAEKMATAKRLNIPFAEAWNGVGHVDYKGRTVADGAQYAKSYEYALKAAANPKNKALVDFIQSALDAGARDR